MWKTCMRFILIASLTMATIAYAQTGPDKPGKPDRGEHAQPDRHDTKPDFHPDLTPDFKPDTKPDLPDTKPDNHDTHHVEPGGPNGTPGLTDKHPF